MKDIKFTEKKVDESWKDQAKKEGEKLSPPKPTEAPASETKKEKQNETSKPFLNFINSLGVQVLMMLGEMENPVSGQSEVNLDAARELIDILSALKDKTEGNLSSEEQQFFFSLVSQLQIKYTEKVNEESA